MDNKDLKESDFNRILWEYFSLHANQRMQILNFYIILETFFVTLLGALYKMQVANTYLHIILSISIIFFSFIFFALDLRTKQIIKYAESALKKIERKYTGLYDEEIMIFTLEDKLTIKKRKSNLFSKIFSSYSILFRLIYSFFALIGFINLILIGIELLK